MMRILYLQWRGQDLWRLTYIFLIIPFTIIINNSSCYYLLFLAKGLLKVEQIHQLARDITYGNRGRLKGKSMEDINSSGNCTTLIMAAIIYWQAKEISRIIKEHNPEEAGIDIMLLAHISPIAWSNVILYGEYKLNKDMVR